MKKIDPLTKEQLETNIFENDSQVIYNRVDYIVNYIAQCFDNKIDYWYFKKAKEGHWGKLENSINDDFVVLHLALQYHANDMIYIDEYNEPLDLYERFPKSWLINDFESEIIEGIKKHKNYGSWFQNLLHKQESYENFNELVQSIKNKLTEDELKLCLRQDFKKIYTKLNKH